MLLRFTEPARRSAARANQFAQRYRSAAIEPHHLLLGLQAVEDGVAVRAWAGLGVHRFRVRLETERLVGLPSDLPVAMAKLPMSANADAAIRSGVRIARDDRHNRSVNTGDLLLGLLAGGDNVVTAALVNASCLLDQLRAEAAARAVDADEEWSSPLWATPKRK